MDALEFTDTDTLPDPTTLEFAPTTDGGVWISWEGGFITLTRDDADKLEAWLQRRKT